MLQSHAMGRQVVRMLYRPILALQAIHKAWSHPPVIQLLEFGTCAHQASTNCYILLRDAHPVKATGGDVSKDHWEAQAEGSMYRLSGVFKCVLIYVCIVLPFSQASPKKYPSFCWKVRCVTHKRRRQLVHTGLPIESPSYHIFPVYPSFIRLIWWNFMLCPHNVPDFQDLPPG